MGALPAIDPMLMIVPLDAIRSGEKALVTETKAKTLTSNIFFASEISVSNSGRL